MKQIPESDIAPLPELLRRSAQRQPEARAIRFMGRDTDFRTVDALTDRAAAWFASRGVRKGDRIGLYGVNSDVFAIAYFGILKAGAVVVPVNLLLNPKEIDYILNDAGVTGLVYHEAFAKAAGEFQVQSSRFQVCIGSQRARPDDLLWADVMACDGPVPAPAIDPAEDLAVILYTSGTTGYPKGAMLTHRNLSANASSVIRTIGFEAGRDSVLVVLPMFHAFAATVGLIAPLVGGFSLVPLPKFEPEAVARTIESAGVTVLPLVPSLYNVLLRLPDEFVPCFRGLRFCVSGGAAMPAEVMRRFEEKFGHAILEGDGPTECSPVTCVNPPAGPRKPQSVGPPVLGVEMKILDEAGRDVPRGTIGEICVRGPNVMKGYWNRPADTAEAFFGEWFRTGDLGTEDDDGYFFIVDRKKDMLITNGMNVYPRIVEETLYKHPAVREAAVVGEPNELHGEIPVAFVSLREGASATASDIRAFCRDHLGRHEIPRKVVFLADLPKNAAGKILKRELRKSGEIERGVDSRGIP